MSILMVALQILFVGVSMMAPTLLCYSISNQTDDENLRSNDLYDEPLTHLNSSATIYVPRIMNGTNEDSKTDPPKTSDSPQGIPIAGIVIVQDDSGMVRANAVSDSASIEANFNWLVVSKTTTIRKVEEETSDIRKGVKRRVIDEDRIEELRVHRDNVHRALDSEIDLTNILRI